MPTTVRQPTPDRPLPRAAAWAALAVALLIGLAACTPPRMPLGPGPTTPRLEADRIVAADGTALPLRVWRPPATAEEPPKAVILALHGFNMYSGYFDAPAGWLAERGFLVYAYDQRGFGAHDHAGLWAGNEQLVADLQTAARLIARRHPDRPLYLLGDSMGGAVVTLAMTRPDPPPAAGAILVAPAVWARDTMPFYQRWALWLALRLFPNAGFTGEGLDIQATDNIEALRALGRDPLVIKRTKVVAMAGMTDLMDAAQAAAPELQSPTLILYGEQDEVIPPEPTLRFWRNLPREAARRPRTALYTSGWHMLLHDLSAATPLADIAAWTQAPDAKLPSAAEREALGRLESLVEGAPAATATAQP